MYIYIFIFFTLYIYIYVYSSYLYVYIDLSSAHGSKVERIDTGEEISMQYVAGVLKVCLEMWNHAVEKLRETVADQSQMLKLLDRTSDADEQTVASQAEKIRRQVADMKTIELKGSEQGCLFLGCENCQAFHVLYIYFMICIIYLQFISICLYNGDNIGICLYNLCYFLRV